MYGGSSQGTFPSISAQNLEKHGLDDFCYISLLYNPVGPREAGQPGLWFDTDPFNPTDDASRVFVRLRAGAWLYVGQYKFYNSADLSQTEWLLQPTQVRNTWTREIWRHSWGRRVRLRVTLRRELQRDPTPEEVKKATEAGKAFKDITPEDILQAYDQGEEHLYIAGMKCVGYDTEFQRKIAEGFLKWIPPPSRASRPKDARAREKKGKKRRAQERRTGSSEGDDDETR
ncbi:hypothetical protein DENSPDRAFT_917569 [Dentipellis sp. KUC8613]|nr:hypothetical protein DENSPDRAFT_917569 [Dentipellis sp. KUC8613]